jgi:hypothetical protein
MTRETRMSDVSDEEFWEIFDDLSRRYPTHRKLADATGIPHTTLWNMKRARQCKSKTRARLLESAKRLGATMKRESAIEVLPEARDYEEALEIVLAKHGGECVGTEDYVLTKEQFSATALRPERAFVAIAKIRIAEARGVVNVLTQYTDRDAQAYIRRVLNREIAELELALRAYSARNPIDVLATNDEQRSTWSDAKSKSKRRKS